MSFAAKCPYCGGLYQAEEAWIGQAVSCPVCGKQIVVPSAAAPVPPKKKSCLLIGCIVGLVVAVVAFVLIVLISAGMLLPALNQSREKARRISCAGNLKQMCIAIKCYEIDYSGHLPLSLTTLCKNDYLADYACYKCPSNDHFKGPLSNGLIESKGGYVYLGEGLVESSGIADIPIVMDKPKNHTRFINIGYGGGHVIGHVVTVGNDRSCVAILNYLHPELSNSKAGRLVLENAKKADEKLGLY